MKHSLKPEKNQFLAQETGNLCFFFDCIGSENVSLHESRYIHQKSTNVRFFHSCHYMLAFKPKIVLGLDNALSSTSLELCNRYTSETTTEGVFVKTKRQTGRLQSEKNWAIHEDLTWSGKCEIQPLCVGWSVLQAGSSYIMLVPVQRWMHREGGSLQSVMRNIWLWHVRINSEKFLEIFTISWNKMSQHQLWLFGNGLKTFMGTCFFFSNNSGPNQNFLFKKIQLSAETCHTMGYFGVQIGVRTFNIRLQFSRLGPLILNPGSVSPKSECAFSKGMFDKYGCFQSKKERNACKFCSGFVCWCSHLLSFVR